MFLLDTRTAFFLLLVISLAFALASAAAVSFRFRDGMGKWALALLVEAAAFVLYGLRDVLPDTAAVAIPNALFVFALAMKAQAVLEFYGRRLAAAWLMVPALLVAVMFYLAVDHFALRVLLAGVCIGTAMLAVAIVVHRIAPTRRPARWMIMVGYLVGSATFAARAALAALDPAGLKEFLDPSLFQSVSLASMAAVQLFTSLGFVLLHLERAEEAAQRLAVIDPLTAVFNRRTFLELADKEIARAQRTQSPLSLIMIDLDHFKKINDEHGHPAGDEVLKCAVEAMKTCLRREDLLVRYGGEEFCVLVPGVGVDQATLLAERNREAVQKLRVPVRGEILAVTISAGVTALRRSVDESIEQLVARADEALYMAKKAGRNRVVSVPDNTTIALLARTQRRAEADESIPPTTPAA